MKHSMIAAAVLALLVLSSCGASDQNTGTNTTTTTPTAEAVKAGDQVIAEGKVVPARSATLSLKGSGTIADVLVKEGDNVAVNQVLVQLDNARQKTNITSAQARLDQAEASYAKLLKGARPEDIAAAEAQVHQAEAQLRQARASVTDDDIQAAEAQLEQAEAQLARLQEGARPTELRASEAQLELAKSQLVTQRDQLSASKTNAKLQLDEAATQLTQAQTSYSTAKWNWDHIVAYGTDPITPSTTNGQTGKSEANDLTDAQKQQYHDALTQAEANLHLAEQTVAQAQVAYDAAQQAEVSGVQAAEQQVISSQATLDQVRAGADVDQVAAARAQLASARANISKLTGDQRRAAIDGAQAAVDAAKASLESLKNGTPESELILAKAQVETAKAEFEQAKIDFEETFVKAPFASIVSSVEQRPDEYVAAGTPVVRLADTSTWVIESTDLTELGIVDIHEGTPATITFDALPDLKLSGKVTRVRTFGENKQGDITYTVTVTPDTQDTRLQWNMTATIALDPAK